MPKGSTLGIAHYSERVRIGPGIRSAPALNTSFKHAEQQPTPGGNERTEIWCVPVSGSLNDCSLVRDVGLLAGIDAHSRCFPSGQGFRIELDKAAINRVREEFQPLIEFLIVLVPSTFLDNLAEYVVLTRMNANGTSQAYSLQPFLFPMRDDPDRAKDTWDSVSLEDGIDDVRASHPNRVFIGQ